MFTNIFELRRSLLNNIAALLKDRGVIHLDEDDSFILLIESDFGNTFQFMPVSSIELDSDNNTIICIDDRLLDIRSELLIVSIEDLLDIYEILSIKIGKSSK